jgi:hypothetical protein
VKYIYFLYINVFIHDLNDADGNIREVKESERDDSAITSPECTNTKKQSLVKKKFFYSRNIYFHKKSTKEKKEIGEPT